MVARMAEQRSTIPTPWTPKEDSVFHSSHLFATLQPCSASGSTSTRPPAPAQPARCGRVSKVQYFAEQHISSDAPVLQSDWKHTPHAGL